MRGPVRFTIRIEPKTHYAELSSLAHTIHQFGQLLAEAERHMFPGAKRPIRWLVTNIQQGSVVLEATAVERQEQAHRVARSVTVGFRSLEHGELPREIYSMRMIRIMRDISRYAVRRENRITVEADQLSAIITEKTAETADKALEPPPFHDYGSVEGSLEMVNIHDAFKCAIYQHVDGRRIDCFFKKEDLDSVKQALAPGQRVVVYGTISYDKEGNISSIRADSFEILPRDDELPDPITFLGLLQGFTDGMTSDEYLERLRSE